MLPQLQLIEDFFPIDSFIEEPPKGTGQFRYDRYGTVTEEEPHIKTAYSRYRHPKYTRLWLGVKNMLQEVYGERLYPTYNFDRFYYEGSVLPKHRDRPSCEVSVSLHIGSNLEEEWPLYFDYNGSVENFTLKPGDAVLYNGVEIYHGRNKMPGGKDNYFHNVFLHYVRKDGAYPEQAYDRFNAQFKTTGT
jgi:hypothetical protein